MTPQNGTLSEALEVRNPEGGSLGLQLSEARRRRGETQRDVVDACAIPLMVYQRLEADTLPLGPPGTENHDMACRVAAVLGIEAARLGALIANTQAVQARAAEAAAREASALKSEAGEQGNPGQERKPVRNGAINGCSGESRCQSPWHEAYRRRKARSNG